MKHSIIRPMAALALLGCLFTPVKAEETAPAGPNIEINAEYEHLLPRLSDGDIATRVTMKAGRPLRARWTEADAVKGVYVTWYATPGQLTVTRFGADGKALSKERVAGENCRQYFEAGEGCTAIEIVSNKGTITPAEAKLVFEGETVPFSGTGADVVVFVPMAGEEYTLYGGLLPRLKENGHKVQLVYVRKADRQTEEESLKALEQLGVDIMPVFWRLSYPGGASPEMQAKSWRLELKKVSAAKLIEGIAPSAVIAPDGSDDELPLWVRAAGIIAADGARNNKLAAKPALYLVNTVSETEANWTEDGAHDTAEKLYAGFDTLWVKHTSVPETASFAEAPDMALLASGEPVTQEEETQAPERAPRKDDEWFRQPGEPAEVVEADVENGQWSYRSDTLSVTIERHVDPGTPLAWCVAHIRMREGNSFRSVIAADLGKQARLRSWRMARKEKAVLLITGDNLTTSETPVKGLLIRGDRFYADRGYEDSVMFDDGLGITLIERKSVNGQEFLESGVRDVFSFGPVLLENGEVQAEKIERHRVAKNGNPRCGVGMVEPGHLVAITVDGRQKGYSEGVDLMEFANMFKEEGCDFAYNFDGGGSTAMVFMGENLNVHGGQSWDKQRFLPEALMWGYSELVPDESDPVSNIGNGWGNLRDLSA